MHKRDQFGLLLTCLLCSNAALGVTGPTPPAVVIPEPGTLLLIGLGLLLFAIYRWRRS